MSIPIIILQVKLITTIIVQEDVRSVTFVSS